ncbi:MAG: ABC transporter ATP-binding protein [Candidatus Micrarchaeota archaeon]|nr:ABC transporter ATP-binding protein [Candidatus Micrarchaeota archaeon]
MGAVIRAMGLTKRYPGKTALDNFSIEVEEGEMLGLLGPNGAGKSTFISIIAGVESPTAGELSLFGAPASKAARRMIGVAPQENAVYPLLTCTENLLYFGSLYGIAGREARARADELLQQLGLADKKDVPAAYLSGGMRRRLNLACALMHRPKVIILDEPTTGLDPAVRNNMWKTVQNVAKDSGATVLLTTHYMEEAEALCSRIILMNSGKVVADGTPAALKKIAGREIAKIKSIPGKYPLVVEKLQKVRGIGSITPTEHGIIIESDDISPLIQDITRVLEKHGEKIVEFSVSRPSLEDVFLKLTGAKLREGGADGQAKLA